MLLHELVQDGDGIQVPADHLVALGVYAPGPDLAVLADDQLVGKAVLQHIGIVVGVVIGENHRLFALRQIEGVADHDGIARLISSLAPHVGDVHQHIAPLIDAAENFVEFIHGHHKVVQPLLLGVAVKGQLRVGDNRMEEEVLHQAVIGGVGDAVLDAALRHHLGVGYFIGLRFRRGGLRRLRRLRVGGTVGGRLRPVGSRVRCGGRRSRAGRQGQQQCQRQKQRQGLFCHGVYLLRAAVRPFYL